jgi:DNA repair exonuclease SbcCD nuclease subunit
MRFLHTAGWHLGRYFHGTTLLDGCGRRLEFVFFQPV